MTQIDTSIQSKNIGTFLAEILERYGASSKDESVDAFMHRILTESGKYESKDKVEAVVKEAIETAFFANEKTVTTDRLLDIIKLTKSISVTLREKIEDLKKVFEKFDFKPANEMR